MVPRLLLRSFFLLPFFLHFFAQTLTAPSLEHWFFSSLSLLLRDLSTQRERKRDLSLIVICRRYLFFASFDYPGNSVFFCISFFFLQREVFRPKSTCPKALLNLLAKVVMLIATLCTRLRVPCLCVMCMYVCACTLFGSVSRKEHRARTTSRYLSHYFFLILFFFFFSCLFFAANMRSSLPRSTPRATVRESVSSSPFHDLCRITAAYRLPPTNVASMDSNRTLLYAHPDHWAFLPLRITLVAGRHRRWLPDHSVRIVRRITVVVKVLLLHHRRGHHRR